MMRINTFQNNVDGLELVGSKKGNQRGSFSQFHISTMDMPFTCFVQYPCLHSHPKNWFRVDTLNYKPCSSKLSSLDRNRTTFPQKREAFIRCFCCWKHSAQNGTQTVARQAQIHRRTSETEVFTNVVLDGQGKAEIDTGIPFLDHMLCQISSHGLLDLHIKASGDWHIDDHHTNEDVGISLGLALLKALGDKRGIQRFGHFIAPLDEALVQVVLDFSGRPYLHYGLNIPTQRVGTFDTQLTIGRNQFASYYRGFF
ncbi:Imidazoleglycerol-phosphate dehydratase [Galdieria sulphuraria]|nr:Imidazoleglycerol-phosphate dehydratase [Galdieria sulphuraria]